MDKEYFELKAAAFFLCDPYDETNPSVSEQLKELIKSNELDDIPRSVIVWEPFVGLTADTLLDYIDNLANTFEEIYNKGKKDK